MQALRQLLISLTMRLRPSRGDQGASLVEYALLLALIAVACMSALAFFGGSSGGSLNNSASSIVNAG
jgi:Flp pilus assembly pilin Flp